MRNGDQGYFYGSRANCVLRIPKGVSNSVDVDVAGACMTLRNSWSLTATGCCCCYKWSFRAQKDLVVYVHSQYTTCAASAGGVLTA